MNKIISLALLIGGVVLIIFGIQATDSFSSDVSRFFTGSPTDKAIWMLIGGIHHRHRRSDDDIARFETELNQ